MLSVHLGHRPEMATKVCPGGVRIEGKPRWRVTNEIPEFGESSEFEGGCDEHTIWGKDTSHLGEGEIEVRYVVHDRVRDDEVEAVGAERQRLTVGDRCPDAALVSELCHPEGQIDRRHFGTGLGDLLGELSPAAPDLQDVAWLFPADGLEGGIIGAGALSEVGPGSPTGNEARFVFVLPGDHVGVVEFRHERRRAARPGAPRGRRRRARGGRRGAASCSRGCRRQPRPHPSRRQPRPSHASACRTSRAR